MAFKKTNLSICNNSIKSGAVPSLWIYYNEDGDAVTTTGFFEEARMTVGDKVMVMYGAELGGVMYRVSAKSACTFLATVVQLAAQRAMASSTEILTNGTQLYNTVSINNPISLLVTSAANTTATFTASASTGNYITLSKAIDDGVEVVLTTATTLPAGLALLTSYFTVNSNGKTCQLSLARGGAAVAITDAGVGVHTATVQKNFFLLADGFESQRKVIKVKTDGGVDAVILPENLLGGTIITAGDALDAMELQFIGGEWQLIKNLGVAVS